MGTSLPGQNLMFDSGNTILQWLHVYTQSINMGGLTTEDRISHNGTTMQFANALGNLFAFSIDVNNFFVIEPQLTEIRSFLTANMAATLHFQDVAAGIRAIGETSYSANRTTGGKTKYVQTFARAENIGNTIFEGSYNINVAQAGALVTFMSFNFSQDGNIRAFKPLDMNGNDIILDLDGDSRFVLGADDVLTLNLAGGAEFLWTTTVFDISTKSLVVSEIAVPSAPGATVGKIFFDSADNTLKIRKSSGTVSLEGGGGVTFPITPDVDVRGNVSTNQAVDISQTDGHVTTMTLTADITITFSGFPAAAKQQTWEVHILQDATGGRTPTFSPAPIEVVSVAKGANLLTILTFLTNDGGTDIHVIPSLRGSVSLSGAAFLPLAGGTMSGDIVMGTNSITGIDDLTFTDEATQPASTVTYLSKSATELIINIPSADLINFKTGAISQMTINATTIDFQGNSVIDGILGSTITGVTGITGLGTQGQSLAMGNFDITGINQLAFNEAGMTITDAANGITIAVPDTTDSIFLDINSRIVQFADGFIDVANNSIDFDERTAPAATANQAKIYSKDVAAVTHMFVIDSAGVETDLTVAGASANQQLSNLVATVAINLTLLPSSDGAVNVGSASVRFGTGHFDILDLQDDQTAQTPGSAVTSIRADTLGMNFGVPDVGDTYDFFFNGVSSLQIKEDGELQFNSSGKRHKIVPQTTSLDIVAELATDNVEITNAPRAFKIAEFGDFLTRFRTKSTTDTSPYELLFKFENLAPEGLTDPNIANITWEGVNSVDTVKTYVQIQAGIDDATATSEDGFFEIFILNDDSLVKHLDLDASGGNLRMGFYGTAAIAQPAHIADPTGGAVIDAEARTAINAILADLASQGLQASS